MIFTDLEKECEKHILKGRFETGKKNCLAYETRNLLCSCQSSGKKIEKTKEIREKDKGVDNVKQDF